MSEKLKIKIIGLNLTRLVDSLVLKNVALFDVQIKRNVLKFFICKCDIETLNNVCHKERKKYEIISRFGIVELAKKIKYCLGFLLAFVICFSYLFSFNELVFDVDVQSSVLNFDTSSVVKFLEDTGVKSGMLKKNLSKSEVKKMIISNFENVSDCNVFVDGGKVLIKVFPGVKNDNEKVKKIISNFDAVVTKVDVFAGESKVSVGDVVKMGDVLIESDLEAKGDVFGKVYFNSTILYNEKQEKIVKTGKYVLSKKYFFRNLFTINHTKQHTFLKYLTKKCVFYPFGNYFIPLACEETLFEEIEIKEEIVPFENVEEEVKNKAYNEALKQIEDVSKITNVSYSIVQENSFSRVDCFVECELKIC